MNQSNAIFFFLFAAYLIFITMRGELPKYMGFLLAAPATPATPANTNPTASNAADNFQKTVSAISKFAAIV